MVGIVDIKNNNIFLEDDSSRLSLNTFKKGVIDDKITQLEHKVQQWETLSKIAKQYKTTVAEIQKYNNIKDVNKIFVNQKIILPGTISKRTETPKQTGTTPDTSKKTMTPNPTIEQTLHNAAKKHIVTKGDTLKKIADQYNTSVDSLMRANNITNPDKLPIGSTLIIDTSASIIDQQKQYEAYINFDIIQGVYEKINKKSDKEKVIDYNKLHPKGNYIVIDKKNAVLQVYNPQWTLLHEFLVGIGKNVGDNITMNTKDERDNDMSGAGIYKINARWGQDRLYDGNSFVLENEKWILQGMAMHQIPNGYNDRYKKMKTGKVEDRRYSNGCLNLTKEDFKTLEKHVNLWSSIYVLPEEKGNQFLIKDGKLRFTTTDIEKDFGKYNYSPKGKEAKDITYEISNKKYNTPIAQEFMQTLVDEKSTLMKEMKLSNDEYNNICKLCFGILGQESEFGTWNKYRIKENAQWFVSWYKKNVDGNNSANSRWLTQIKPVNIVNNPILQKYNITMESLNKPKDAAIATMVIIGQAYKELKWLRQANKLTLPITDANIYDYVLYMYQNRWEIFKGTATPDKNQYLKNVKNYASSLKLSQKENIDLQGISV